MDAMLADWQELIEQAPPITPKFLSFESCLWLVMAMVSMIWLMEYRATRLFFTQIKDSDETPVVNITLLQNKNIIEPAKVVSKEAPPQTTLPASVANSPKAFQENTTEESPPPKSKSRITPKITPPSTVPTYQLLEEAIKLSSPGHLPKTTDLPQGSNIFNPVLRQELGKLRKKRISQSRSLPLHNQLSFTTDAYGDLHYTASNGCTFRRDDSGGILDGTWYAVGCKKDGGLSLKSFTLKKITKPSFKKPSPK